MTDVTTAVDEPTGTDVPDGPDTAPRRTFGQWLRDRDRRELLAWILLLAIAIFLRVYDLGSRAFHHDESQDAYFSYLFSKDWGSYQYDPLLHGPLRFLLTAFNYTIFGDSNFTARLAPAYMGVIAVGLPYLIRKDIGRVAAFAAGVMLCVSPSFLYFSRFAREDIYLATLMFAVIVACFRFINRPRTATLCLVFALAALSFAMKEAGLVMDGLIALYFMIAAVVQGVRSERFLDAPVIKAVRSVGAAAWVSATATLVITYSAMFTMFFSQGHMTARLGPPDAPIGVEKPSIDAIYYGLDYWHGQQSVARGSDKPWLYTSILIGNEWPIVLLAFVGLYATIRKPTLFRAFACFYFAGTMAFYCWGSERFAWLVLHPLLPLILMAGIGVGHLWTLRSKVARIASAVAVAIGFAYLVTASYVANATEGTDPASMLVSTQSSSQVAQVAREVVALDKEYRKTHKVGLTITVDQAQGATFPYAWYFRHLSAGYPDVQTTPPASQVEIMTEEAHTAQLPALQAYDCRQFDFRVWWVKDYSKQGLSTWWKWFTKRTPWDTTGGLKEWFCLRRDVGPLPGKNVTSDIPPPAPPAPAPASG
jgi:uncharacterized protein (TIGR03663 family)